jgi:hypothetical protein
VGDLRQLLGQEAAPRGGDEGGVAAGLTQVKEAARGAPAHGVVHIQPLRQGCTVAIAAKKSERGGGRKEEWGRVGGRKVIGCVQQVVDAVPSIR